MGGGTILALVFVGVQTPAGLAPAACVHDLSRPAIAGGSVSLARHSTRRSSPRQFAGCSFCLAWCRWTIARLRAEAHGRVARRSSDEATWSLV
jgi:hypothetical protein